MTQNFKGRGALSNPPVRFEATRTEAVDDGWYTHELPDSIATKVMPERARTIITTNDSPDVPFEQSINPYRGCEHGCVYCLSGDTPILLADGTTRALAAIRPGQEIFGTQRQGHYRRYVRTRVLAHWSVIKPAYKVTLADGTELIAGPDHRFLTEHGWKFVTGAGQGADARPHLTVNNKLMGVGAFAGAPEKDRDFRRGYLCGVIRGDGTLGDRTYDRPAGGGARIFGFRLALCDSEALERAHFWLQLENLETDRFLYSAGSDVRKPMYGIRTAARAKVEQIWRTIAWPPAVSRSWQAGFLSGLFDAEGSYSGGILRISNTDPNIVAWTTAALTALGVRFVLECVSHQDRKPVTVVRVVGGLREHLRFFHSCDPVITRKRDIAGQAVKSTAQLGVVSIEPLGRVMRLYDISTGTEDFIANGVVSHNCFARPSHAYVGLSPGLEFETNIFYKQDATALLRAELCKRSYVCKPINLGANTDPYQPVEKRLKVTRSILEVLRDCRHPVTIVTKGVLILRDLELLAELARLRLVSVMVSLTTLDPEVKRVMEPRAAAPQARLRMIRELTAAGIPTGVLVAPVIPLINDPEIEDLVAAAAQAGALRAGYVVLRLPHEIKDLFREWLAEHYPLRAAHVMSLINDLRGGRDYDSTFGTRMRGTGPFAELLRRRFQLARQRAGLDTGRMPELTTTLFRPPGKSSGQTDFGF